MYLLDCGTEVFVWIGRTITLDERKSASGAAEELLRSLDRPKCHIIRIIEGFETVPFRSKFDSWPETARSLYPKTEGAKLLGINVNGLLKAAPAKDEPQPYIDCT
ncbi:hypothetical protein RND81_13G156400 [Saponaria officinalis]|uniref:Gelsolin-like domain-containing protein n=1 Tax=Saponaria officinalis TaxID=3572 RepID=A0AAW1H147_SAPOF